MHEEKEESEEKKGKCGETVSEGTCDFMKSLHKECKLVC